MSIYDSLTRQYTDLEYLRKPNLADPRESSYILQNYCGFITIPDPKSSCDIKVNECGGVLKIRGNNSKISINLGPKCKKRRLNTLERDHIFEKYWPNNTR
jgi:hypothetical protein